MYANAVFTGGSSYVRNEYITHFQFPVRVFVSVIYESSE